MAVCDCYTSVLSAASVFWPLPMMARLGRMDCRGARAHPALALSVFTSLFVVTLGSSVVDGRLLAMRCTNGGLPDAVWPQPRASRSDRVRGGALTQGPHL